MSKYMKIIVAALMAVAMAAPAFADSKISGYFRNQFIADNLGASATSADKRTAAQVDQRLRIRYQNNLNEYVHFVYYGEVDTLWGQPSKGAIGGGGQLGADGVNVETKNAYLDFKIPNSIWSVRTGVQGFGDRFENVLVADDMAGIQINHKFLPNLDVTTAYFKWSEGNTSQWDDRNLYAIQTAFKVMDNFNLNVDGYWLEDDTVNGVANDLYTIGVAADGKVAMVGLSGFAFYQFGQAEPRVGTSLDYSAYAASGKATAKVGPAALGLRLSYFSEDDDRTDNDLESVQGGVGAYEFAGENLMIFFSDKFYNNTNGGRKAMTDAAFAGYGLFAINATADFKLPANLYLNAGAGYFMALEEAPTGAASLKREDSDLGFEIAARIGTKVAEKVDVSLGGAYAVLGDFYKTSPTAADPDDYYKVNFMFNVGF